MTTRLLIIGNISDTYHLGSMLVRAAKEIKIPVFVMDTDWKTYAPSMEYFLGRIYYRLAGKRPLEWWLANRKTARLIRKVRPTLVLVTGITPLAHHVFEAAHQVGAKVVNYLTDSPWSPQNSCLAFAKNLPKYDWVFSTKTSLLSKLVEVGSHRVEFVPFAFDPTVHYPPHEVIENLNTIFPDVCLIGGADRWRIHLVKEFISQFEGCVGLYGGYWCRDRQLKNFYRGFVLGDIFCRTIQKSKINIGLVRRANGDGHSMRSYEIPACGGVGIYEDTVEHRTLFNGYPEYGFFTSSQDLAEKCKWLLEHAEERERMRSLGMQVVATESNTYANRLRQILTLVKQQVPKK